MADVAQLLFNGVLVGSIYALGGVGLTLVYGILRLANFAHGDLLTVGAYAAWLVVASSFWIAPWHIGLALAVLLTLIATWDALIARRFTNADRSLLVGAQFTVVVLVAASMRTDALGVRLAAGLAVAGLTVALLAVLLDLTLWSKLRRERANILTLMIVSVGLAFVLRSAVQVLFGGDQQSFFAQSPGRALGVEAWLSGLGLELRITQTDLWVLGTALVGIIVTHVVLKRTRTGKAMRALSDDRSLAEVSGIDTKRVTLYVWVLGGALAGVAGPMLGLVRAGFIDVNIGWVALLSLFAAVILGGIGSATGAMLGGLLIGVTQEISTLFIDTSYKLAVGFAILILTLLVRPQGIMGVRE